jgi:peroxiredoxin
MNAKRIIRSWSGILQTLVGTLVLSTAGLVLAKAAMPPKAGDAAPNFTLKTVDDKPVELQRLTTKSKVVLIILRGWPGYQCPICDRQVQDFIGSATAFAELKAQLVFVYPGPASDLKAHAEEFKSMKGKQWPNDYLFVLDPDYSVVNAYGIRWDAPMETAYPSTFVLDTNGVVRFAKISHGHGDRAKAADIFTEIKKLGEK